MRTRAMRSPAAHSPACRDGRHRPQQCASQTGEHLQWFEPADEHQPKCRQRHLPHEDFGDQATQHSSRHTRAGGRAAAGISVMRKVPPRGGRAWLVLIRCPVGLHTFPGRRGKQLEAKQFQVEGSGGTPVPTPRIGDEKTCLALPGERRRPGSPTARRLPDRCGRRRAGQVGAQEELTEDDLPTEACRGAGATAVAHDRGGTPQRCAADQPRRRGSGRRHTRRPPGYSRHTSPPVRKRERRERAQPGSPWEQRGADTEADTEGPARSAGHR